MNRAYKTIVIGGGHAGAEAAWTAANALGEPGSIALVTIDPATIGKMSCNPAIGGLAKGQLVREIDALGGLMGLAADATGIQFKMLNTSKGPAVHGPRAQCDRHAYAEAVRAMIESRNEIDIVAGTVEEILTEGMGADRRVTGVRIAGADGTVELQAATVILTTGTFMRGLMHTGQTQTPGGRVGEQAATGISKTLEDLGFELGRLKTGTPPRLKRSTIDWESLPPQHGDDEPYPFSDLSKGGWQVGTVHLDRFPLIEQQACRQTRTTTDAHDAIKANLDRAPMFTGQIESTGPRYCPSIEDKVVRFDRESHGVFLEPESLRDEFVYCNGIATSLPSDVQDSIVRTMPGCENADILCYGYAVEYDTVLPHQILATCMTKSIAGLFFAGQINGTSGYEEAAAQGLVAGLNAARFVRDETEIIFGRDEAYIGVLMDDLVTKTPVEPYRMFTSRAEHRLMLRADNSADRLTPRAIELGLLKTDLGTRRIELFERRRDDKLALRDRIARVLVDGRPLDRVARRPEFDLDHLAAHIELGDIGPGVAASVLADLRYEPYIEKERAEIRRRAEHERRAIPGWIDYGRFEALRAETREALARFRPSTFGQAGRLEGITPADLTLLAVLIRRESAQANAG